MYAITILIIAPTRGMGNCYVKAEKKGEISDKSYKNFKEK
tara:strand:- start:520 stop:639 length:120 start_codon:yes stop_codon:yes gene_type:complete